MGWDVHLGKKIPLEFSSTQRVRLVIFLLLTCRPYFKDFHAKHQLGICFLDAKLDKIIPPGSQGSQGWQ